MLPQSRDIIAAAVIVKDHQGIPDAVHITADENFTHSRIERSQIKCLHSPSGEAHASKTAYIVSAAFLQIVDQTNVVKRTQSYYGKSHRYRHIGDIPAAAA